MTHWEDFFSLQKLTRSEILRLFFCVILLGLWGAQFGEKMQYALLGGIGCMGLGIVWKKPLFILGVVFAIALAYAQWRVFPFPKSHQIKENETQEITGTVVSFPERKEKDVRVFVDIHNNQKILLIAPPEVNLHYGDILRLVGSLSKPRNFNGFDYKKYLQQSGVSYIMRFPKNLEIQHSQSRGWWWLRFAENTRNILAYNINKSIPLPHSDIALGILLGVKKELPQSIQQDFKQSGLQHILVVSGFNVSVVMIFLMLLLGRFGRKIVFGGSMLGILFFVGMTGGDPPVIRAAIMGSLVGWASCLGRFSDVRNIILFSFVLMGLFSPITLQQDVSFFLSASATVGIILGTSLVENWIKWIPNIGKIRSILSVTLSAQIAVFPVIGLFFGKFPIIGILSNLLVEPLVPVGMLFSFGTSVFGFLPESLSRIVGIPAFIILEAILSIAHFWGQIPPIPIAGWVSWASLLMVLGFFLWGFFSRNFSKKYLEVSSVLDFSGQTGKNPHT